MLEYFNMDKTKTKFLYSLLQVCRRKKQCVLPARTTVEQLLSEYTRAKTANKAEKLKNNKEKAITEVTAGVREYFNVMLASQLLYRQVCQRTRQQWCSKCLSWTIWLSPCI